MPDCAYRVANPVGSTLFSTYAFPFEGDDIVQLGNGDAITRAIEDAASAIRPGEHHHWDGYAQWAVAFASGASDPPWSRDLGAGRGFRNCIVMHE